MAGEGEIRDGSEGSGPGDPSGQATATVRMTTVGLDAQPVEVDIPRELGPVRLIKQVGRGGMGMVYLGHHRFLDRDVAVKFLLNTDAGADEAAFDRFIDETSSAARVDHPSLVRILHADLIERVPYLVMEYIDGPTLHDLVSRHNGLPLDAAMVALHDICAAIGVLHDEGIVHRDIKPNNVLIDSDGRLVVTDFGLAVERRVGAIGGTRERVAGTPAYMAPEMFDGEVSTRSDVYALGILGFELLTGTLPFGGSIEEVQPLHKEAPLPIDQLTDREVPEEIIEIVERATYKDVVFRYKTARHLTRALESSGVGAKCLEKGRATLEHLLRHGEAPVRTDAGADTPASSSSSYFERLSQLADDRLRTTAAQSGDATPPLRTPGAVPVNEGDGDEATEPTQEDDPRHMLHLVRCPECDTDLTQHPRRYRCPKCTFLYDEEMFQVAGWSDRSMAAGVCRAFWWFLGSLTLSGGLFAVSIVLATNVFAWIGFGLSVLLLMASVFLWRDGLRKRCRRQIFTFSRHGLAKAHGPARLDFAPWSEFYDWTLENIGDDGWELHLKRDCGAGLSYFVTQDPIKDQANFRLAFPASKREVALIRREIRERLRSARGF